jgi:glycolate oxidase iron-sulfur subunit
MSAVASGVLEIDDAFDEVMSFCLQCRACEAACPSLVPFGRAMEGARAELAAARPTPSRRLRHRVLGSWIARRRVVGAVSRVVALAQLVGAARWLPGRLGRSLRGMRRLPLVGRTVGRSLRERLGSGGEPGNQPLAGLLVGCVMEPWFGRVHQATVEVLGAAGYRVVVPEGQTCCGALAAHDGAAERAAGLAARNAAAFAGVDLIVTDAAGCTAHMRGYDHWVGDGIETSTRVRDVVEVVADAISSGRLRTYDTGRSAKVAVQDPCHHRHALRIVDPVRVIVRAAGYEPVDLDADGLCCGAAGVYSLSRPQASRELGRRKAEQMALTGAATVASANPGCEMQLRAHVDRDVRVAHPVELYAEAAGLI